MNTTSIHNAAIAALALVLCTSIAHAADAAVSKAWFRKLPAGVPAGGYFELHNDGDKALLLTSASSPACGMLMLHKSENMGGMDQMSMADSIKVDPHKTLSFAPGGYHLMCMQPSMRVGYPVPVTLEFADGSKLTATFVVRDARGE
jgi:periplasmic copper chaperone A